MPPVTLMDKARDLAGKSALLILPLAAATPAQTATLQADYSFVGEHSSSGWFMSAASFNDLAAGASTSGSGAHLTASHQVDDGMFWTWNDLAQETMRRYDVTGVAFAWGGGITGAVFEDDRVQAQFDLTIAFTHTPVGANDAPYVWWELYVGTRNSPYTPEAYQRGPQGWSGSPLSGSFDSAGSHRIQGSLDRYVGSDEAGAESSWYAMLVLNWTDSAYARPGYPDGIASRNGDLLSVTTNPIAPMTVALTATNVQEGQVLENSGSYTVTSAAPTYKVLGTLRNLAGGLFGVAGAAQVGANGSFSNAGLLSVLGGASFQNEGRVDNLAGAQAGNAGYLRNVLGGLIGNAGQIDNLAEGSIENEGSVENLFGGVFGNGGSFSNRDTGTVTNAAGATIRNSGSLYNAFGGLMGNAGRMDNLATGSIDNAGTLQNLLGGLLGNAGQLNNHSGAEIRNAAGATFENTGTVQNLFGGLFGNAGTLDNAAGASFQNDGTFNGLFGGVVNNRGSFVNTSANTVNNDGAFHNYHELVNDTWGRFNNTGALTNHAGASFTTTGEFNNNGTLANAGTAVVRRERYEWEGEVWLEGGAFTNTGQIQNTGRFVVQADATVAGSGSYTQASGVTVVDGSLQAATLRFDGGRVEGAGTLGSSLVQNLGATFSPGGDGGYATLTIDGGYLQGADATLVLDLGLAGQQDLLYVPGDVALAGTLVLNFDADVRIGSSYLVLALADGASLSGSFAQVQASWGRALVDYGSDGVSVTLLAAPVPEPSAWALLAGGFAVMGFVARRRRQQADGA